MPIGVAELPAEHAAPESPRPLTSLAGNSKCTSFPAIALVLPLTKVTPEASYCTPAASAVARPRTERPWHSGRVPCAASPSSPLARAARWPRRPRSASSAATRSTSATRRGACSCCTAPCRAASLCSGAIVDASTSSPPAHCVGRERRRRRRSTLTVRAGVTNAATPSPTDSRAGPRRSRASACTRGYVHGCEDRRDDVAVLTLTTRSTSTAPTARAIALPSASTQLEFGDSVTLAGFGLKVDQRHDRRHAQRDERHARRPERVPAAGRTTPRTACCSARSPGPSSPCSGDSGSALVLPRPTPVVSASRAPPRAAATPSRRTRT